MSPGSSTKSYPTFARIGLRENLGKNLNQVTCPDRNSNPGHLVSRPDALTVTPQRYIVSRETLRRYATRRSETNTNGTEFDSSRVRTHDSNVSALPKTYFNVTYKASVIAMPAKQPGQSQSNVFLPLLPRCFSGFMVSFASKIDFRNFDRCRMNCGQKPKLTTWIDIKMEFLCPCHNRVNVFVQFIYSVIYSV
ncbi:hypothetical protein ANN_06856 [Periplaneta americana]|uniref:Uncharacterized protein n=1 Tax=Periplaneta americana TaxID=6978 RepID=A0ABQ8TGK4_PERAM|nr:hypothetical protein ANN_06856 [Periplaneta americana]